MDAAAGTGKFTAWFAARFGQLIAVEPNLSLTRELQNNCPTVAILPVQIADAEPPPADFVLCSHVFYYILAKTGDKCRTFSELAPPRRIARGWRVRTRTPTV